MYKEKSINHTILFINHSRHSPFLHTYTAGRYTALVPHDAAFYSYYPIDWGFNPFLVHNFTKDVLLNHFVRGNIDLDTLPALAELTTLGGRVIKFTRRGGECSFLLRVQKCYALSSRLISKATESTRRNSKGVSPLSYVVSLFVCH